MQKTSKKWLLLALVPALAAVYFYMHHEPAEVPGESTVMITPEGHPTVELETSSVAHEQPEATVPQPETEVPTQAAPEAEEVSQEPSVDFETKPSDASEAEVQKPVEKVEEKKPELKQEIEAEVKPSVRKVIAAQPQEQKVVTSSRKTASTDEEDNDDEKESQSTSRSATKTQNANASQGTKEVQISFPFDKKTLGYKHWSGRHFPSKWVLKLNGKEVLWYDSKPKVFHQKARSISIDPSKPLKAHFDWEFLGGKRKGWKEIDYKVDQSTGKISFEFDWKNEPGQLTSPQLRIIDTRSSDNKKE